MSTLDELRAKVAAARATEDERRAAAAEAAEIALCTAQLEHGPDRAEIVHSKAGPVVLRAPTTAEMRRFADELWSDKPGVKSGAGPKLADACRVYPDAATYRDMLARYPGIASPLGVVASRLGGLIAEEEAGKS